VKLNHQVTAFVRSADKLKEAVGDDIVGKITVIVGDASDRVAIANAMKGHDAVVSAAFTTAEGEASQNLTKNILELAETQLAGPKRVVITGGLGAMTLKGSNKSPIELGIMPPMYQTHINNFNTLKQHPNIDWTFICPGPMVPSPTGKLIEDIIVGVEEIPLDIDGTKSPEEIGQEIKTRMKEMVIPYEDLAHLVVSNLQGGTRYKHHRIGAILPKGSQLEKPEFTLGSAPRT
jgi:putative NADH-flavin reductase